MNKSMRLMVLAFCATGLVVTQGWASEVGNSLETPLLKKGGAAEMTSPVNGGDEKKSDSASASSSANSSPEKKVAEEPEEIRVLKRDKEAKAATGCTQKIKQWLRNLTDKQRELLGYAGVALLAGGNEAYSELFNPSYGFPLAIFVGQLAALVAKERPYLHKFTAGMGIGFGVSIIELILYRTHHRIPDLLFVASSLAFVLHSTILDLMKKNEGQDVPTKQNGDESYQADG